MQPSVFLFREFAQAQQSHCESVAENKGRRGTGGRREVERAGFFGNGLRNCEVGKLCEGGFRVAGECRDGDAEAFRGDQHADQFIAFPAVTERQQQVPLLKHSEVAVHGFDRMDENSGGAGAGECRGDLFADMPAFADDSGLEVAVLNGAPGIFSARYAGDHASDAERIRKLLEEMKGKTNRRARFVCVIALAYRGNSVKTFRGEVNGTMVSAMIRYSFRTVTTRRSVNLDLKSKTRSVTVQKHWRKS